MFPLLIYIYIYNSTTIKYAFSRRQHLETQGLEYFVLSFILQLYDYLHGTNANAKRATCIKTVQRPLNLQATLLLNDEINIPLNV